MNTHLEPWKGHKPFTPDWIIGRLGLTTPTGYSDPAGWTYRKTACHGHFGRELFPWEKLDLVEELDAASKVAANA